MGKGEHKAVVKDPTASWKVRAGRVRGSVAA